MSVIEVLLRLGCSMVAWMIIYTHLIWTATLEVTGCTNDGDQMWRLLLGFAPITLGFCFLVSVSHKMKEVHQILVWFAAPLVLLVPMAVLAVWPWLLSATFDGQGICTEEAAASWHVWWAPAQLLVIATIVYVTGRNWLERTKTA